MQDPILKYLKGNYWKGEPERHSEAAKLGWELRGTGFIRTYERKDSFMTIILHPKQLTRSLDVFETFHNAKNSTASKQIDIAREHKGTQWYVRYSDFKFDPWKSNNTNVKVKGPFKTQKEAKQSILIQQIVGD